MSKMTLTEKTANTFGFTPDASVPHASLVGRSLNAHFLQVPLASLLPYQTFDTVSELYYNQNSIGFVLETAPLIGASEDMIKTLNGMLSDMLPDEAISQWLLWASPRVEHILQRWCEKRAVRGGYYAKLAKLRTDFFTQGVNQSLIRSIPLHRVRNFRCFISVTLPYSEKAANKLAQARDKLLFGFAAMKSDAMTLRPDALLSACYALINPDKEAHVIPKEWDDTRSLSAQLVSPETKLTVKEHAIQLAERAITTYSMESLPKYWAQQQNRNLIGDEDNSQRQPQGEFFLQAVVKALPIESIKTKTLLKSDRAEKTANSKLAKFIPRAGKTYQDWKHAHEQIDSGNKLVEVFYQAICYSDVNDVDAAESAMKEVFNTKGWVLKRDKYLTLQSWLAMLPMRVDAALWSDLKAFHRIRTITSFNAANLLPLQGEWKGGNSPGMLLTGKRGQLTWFDNFSNLEGNYNVVVTGESRSGKSVALQELAFDVASSGGRVFVFDIGRSFEKSCKYFEGDFVEFRREIPICINPFTHINDFNEAIELLLPLFAKMVSNKRELNEMETSYLQQALRYTWQTYKNEGDVDKVAAWLSKHTDARASDLGTMLDAWTSAGQYGRYLNGRCNVDFSNPYLVLELEELNGKPELQSVVLMTMMYQITEVMYRGDRKTPIICIIDEAWSLLDDKVGGRFIEVGYRRAAKYKGAFVSGTQSLLDYDKNDSVRSIRANSSITVILKQRPESIETAATKKLIDGDTHLKQTLRTLNTRVGEYAEMCIMMGGGYSVVRLQLDAFSGVLYSSKAEHVASVNDCVNAGFTMEQAIEETIKKIQQGVL